MLHVPGLYVQAVPEKGRGVFCANPLAESDLIEICPVILLAPEEREHIDKTTVYEYYFIWPDGKGTLAILLGFGSLYNHDAAPNAKVYFDMGRRSVEIRCLRPIPAGEEICIDYRSGEKDPAALWFDIK